MSPDPPPPLEGNPLLEQRLRLGALTRDDPDRQRLVRRYAYGIPTDEVLDAIAAVSPAGVVELGAGTGYWARLLHDRGVDLVAMDAFPPERGDNRFVDRVEPWHPVLTGDADTVAAHAERTLLVVWPTWNETWAGDAVAAYPARHPRPVPGLHPRRRRRPVRVRHRGAVAARAHHRRPAVGRRRRCLRHLPARRAT